MSLREVKDKYQLQLGFQKYRVPQSSVEVGLIDMYNRAGNFRRRFYSVEFLGEIRVSPGFYPPGNTRILSHFLAKNKSPQITYI